MKAIPLIQGEKYIFEYGDSELKNRVNFSYHQLRESFETIYTHINSNPYAWVRDKIEAKSYEGKLITITQNQFSNLCQIIYENEHLRSIILLILEATNSSLLLMPAGLAVALEGLSEYFYSSHKDILNPIQNKGIDKDFSKELLCVLGIRTNIKNPSTIIEGRNINNKYLILPYQHHSTFLKHHGLVF